MKFKKMAFLFVLIFSFVMTSSLVFASNAEILEHEHDSYCNHDIFDHFEKMRTFSIADMVANDYLGSIGLDFSEFAQFSIADEIVRYLEENKEISTFSSCAHPVLTWKSLGTSGVLYGSYPSTYCYKIISFDSGSCAYCGLLIKFVETTTYTYCNFPSNGGMCKNGCGAGLVR